MLFFQKWEISDGLEAHLAVRGGDAVIGGVAVAEADAEDLIAYPGVLNVELAESPWMTAKPQRLALTGLSEGTYLEVEPSDGLIAEVQEQANARLDECVASTDLRPEGCPFREYVYGDVRNVAWTITNYPTVDMFSMERFTLEGGQATVTYEVENWDGEWVAEESESDIGYFSGEVAIDGDDVELTFND